MSWPYVTTPSGTKSFINVVGDVLPLKSSNEKFARPGVNGHEYRRLGKHAAPTTIECETDVISESAADDLIDDMAAAQGTIQTYQTSEGRTKQVFISDVQFAKIRYMLGHVGGVTSGSGHYIVMFRLTVEATS